MKINLSALFTGLTILFVILKLNGTITWSWVWVLSFLWLPLAVALAAMLFALVVTTLVAALALRSGNIKVRITK